MSATKTRAFLNAWGRTAKRGRPVAPPKPPPRAWCEFCRNIFEQIGRADRPRRTCSMACAVGLRRQKKQLRARERFLAARACRFLMFPKGDSL